jgi:hypothetical protein
LKKVISVMKVNLTYEINRRNKCILED